VKKIKKKVYEKELRKLQIELVKLQRWVKEKGLKVIVIFEGRDAAGKGGVIKLPERQDDKHYIRPPLSDQTFVPEVYPKD